MDPRDLKKEDLGREARNLRQRIIELEESCLQKDHIIQKYSLLANIVESLNDAVFSSTVNGTIVTWNKSAEKIYGYTAQEVSGCDVSMFVPPDRKEEMLKILKKVTSGQRVDYFETVRLRKDGTPFHVSLAVFPILNTTRKIAGICAITRDITERKRAESVLQESETKFRELFEHISSCVAVYKAVNGGDDFVIIDFNAAAEKTEGVSRKDVIGKSVRTVFPGVENLGLFEVFKRVYMTGVPEKHPTALYTDQRMSRWRENYVYKLPSSEIVAVYEDVTERKRTEENLNLMNERFILATRAARLGVWDLDIQKNELLCDDRMNELYGVKREGSLGTYDAWFRAVHPDDRAESDEIAKAALRGERAYDAEFRIVWPDGTIKVLKSYGMIIRDSQGNPIRMIGVNYDITKQKETEEALQEREKIMRYIIKYDPNAVAVYDVNLNYIAVSDRYLQDYKVKEGDIIGKHYHEVFPEVSKKWKDVHQRCLSGAIERNDDDYFERSDGSITYNRWECRPWYHTDGQIGGMITYTEVTTERKRAEIALKESEAKYRSIFENAVEGIFQSTPEGRLLSVNPAYARMVGYGSPEEMVETITDLGGQLYVNPEDREQFKRRIEEQGVVEGFEVSQYHKDGSVIWVSINARSVQDLTGKALYYEGTIEDITARKTAGENLERHAEKLRKSLLGTINALSMTVEARDPYTSGHQKNVSRLARAIAQDMALPSDTIDNIRIAGSIHDIGKIAVPSEILSKPGKLKDIEFSLIKVHSQKGYDILKDAELPYPVAEIVLQHHERLDGSGYPQGLKDGQILLEAQIIIVADVVEAMSSHRPYRPALGIEIALEEIEKNKGIFYDSVVVDACVRLFREKGFKLE